MFHPLYASGKEANPLVANRKNRAPNISQPYRPADSTLAQFGCESFLFVRTPVDSALITRHGSKDDSQRFPKRKNARHFCLALYRILGYTTG